MKTNILATAVALPDQDLLPRIQALAGNEREATAELVGHLAALQLRPSLYEGQGYGSLFAYCVEALRLSEDAACNRIEAARACRRFPVILDLLGSGSLTLTSVRMLRKHLTPENHEAVLARARHQKKEQIEALVAELAPKPDVVTSVRKVTASGPTVTSAPDGPVSASTPVLELVALTDQQSDSGAPRDATGAGRNATGAARDGNGSVPPPAIGPAVPPLSPAPRPVVQALAPGRYRVQFTIGQEAYDKLRCLQTLLRREVPGGDAGVIFERFVDVLLDKVERDKLGKRGKVRASATTRRRSSEARTASPAYENRIRSGTDKTDSRDTATGLVQPSIVSPVPEPVLERRQAPSRHIPSAVRRAVWFRDRAQCAFVADTGHRCSERSFLELHHIQPYALDGPPTIGNVSLRCRRHNRYEAELVFGARKVVSRDQGR